MNQTDKLQKKPHLDSLDLKLLWILDLDGRASLSTLAGRLNRSQQLISFRFNRLRKLGLIKSGITLINFHLIGLWSFRLFLRMRQIKKDNELSFCQHLSERKDVLWLAELSGKWDYEIVFRLKSYVDFARVWKEIQAKFGVFYEQADISMTTVTYHFRRDYLAKKVRREFADTLFGNASHTVELSPTDHHLLELMASDCRISMKQLQKRLKLGFQRIRERIKFLEQCGVIQGYRMAPNTQILKRTYLKALIKLNYDGPASEKRLYEFCAAYPFVTYLSEVLGSWQFEIECEVAQRVELEHLLRDVRREFPRLIRDYDVVEVTREVLLNYM